MASVLFTCDWVSDVGSTVASHMRLDVVLRKILVPVFLFLNYELKNSLECLSVSIGPLGYMISLVFVCFHRATILLICLFL